METLLAINHGRVSHYPFGVPWLAKHRGYTH
jgi:hypothetical protein